MNISTAALLNILPTKLENSVKEKIQNSSTPEGKSDLSSLLKEKSIHSLLSDTLKELSKGIKTKQSILNLLQNSKHMFDLKSFSVDIKDLSQQLDKSENPKLKQQSVVLKEFFTNIKNIDNNILKQNISNSGVMLESKLKDIAQLPKADIRTQKLHFIKDLSDVVLNLKALEPKADDEKSITLLKNVIDNFINKSNKNNGIEEQTKKAVFDLLNNLNTKEPKALKETISQFTDIEQKVLKDIEGLNNSKLLNFSLSELKKSIKTIDQKGIAAIDIQKLKDIGDTLTKGILKSDTTIETKVSVQSLLNNLNNITKEPTEQPSAQILNNILSNTVKLEQILNHTPIHKHINPKVIESSSIKNLTSDLNSLIDLVKSISNKPIDNTHISQLQNITQNLSKEISSLDIKVEVKTAVHNLLNNLNTVVENQKLQPAPLQLQTITNEAVKINTLLSKTAGALNNISEPQLQNQLDITKDIKAALLIIQENGNSDQSDLSKELKATVDKLISQIEFFQGLSYTSAANYTFVPFSWENMEDGDIRFSSNKDDNFSCQINLNLKNYGELKILLDLESKNYININVGVQSEILRGMFQKNLQKLRIGINRIDLNLQSLNIFDLNELKEKKEITDIYNGNESLNFGLDLKV